jgi:hypothetical protein
MKNLTNKQMWKLGFDLVNVPLKKEDLNLFKTNSEKFYEAFLKDKSKMYSKESIAAIDEIINSKNLSDAFFTGAAIYIGECLRINHKMGWFVDAISKEVCLVHPNPKLDLTTFPIRMIKNKLIDGAKDYLEKSYSHVEYQETHPDFADRKIKENLDNFMKSIYGK